MVVQTLVLRSEVRGRRRLEVGRFGSARFGCSREVDEANIDLRLILHPVQICQNISVVILTCRARSRIG